MTRHTMQMLPPHQYYFQTDNGYEIRTYEADDLREAKLSAVAEWKAAKESAPVEYNGHLFDFDYVSQQRVTALALAGIGSPTGTWTTADNVDVPANADFMQGLFAAMVTRVGTTHDAQRRMKNELAALTDPALIAAYEVPQP